MKALFVTTDGTDPAGIISAWDYWNAEPAIRVKFEVVGTRVDGKILAAAEKFNPKVVFYIGGQDGNGQPTMETLKKLKGSAKTIHICCDATDGPWHPTLIEFRKNKCFDLQVSVDGALHAPAIDMSTISPINPRHYDVVPMPPRDTRCGFSGQYGMFTERESLVVGLERLGLLKTRVRTMDRYDLYVDFMQRCQLVFNVPLTGSATRMHVKGRAVETALAGAAILEMYGSPLDKWFPRESIFFYSRLEDAAKIINTASKNEIADKAALYHEVMRTKYDPQKVYGEMLNRVGL